MSSRIPDDAIPFFQPSLGDAEIAAALRVLRSGWLTTGAECKAFEREFAESVDARHAVAVNSCTAALHLAVEALGLRADQRVVVPTMTFGATAEVVRYMGATPLFADCDTDSLLLDLEHAARLLQTTSNIAGMMPVHVAGAMVDMNALNGMARDRGLWVVEDAAHSFPAAWRASGDRPWRTCGCGDADVTCFSFYANKTITTGEGGMAVTASAELAERMRVMSLHGISKDAWKRYSSAGSWYYEITAPGFKYNLTDLAAAIGREQLRRAEALRSRRERLVDMYFEALRPVEEITLPPRPTDRLHSWHLFIIQLRLERLAIDRAQFIEEMRARGITCSVHWMPLHLHPYYRQCLGSKPEDCPRATEAWKRLVTLPLFPDMTERQLERVVEAVRDICRRHRPAAAHV